MKKSFFNEKTIKKALVILMITGIFLCVFPSIVFAIDAEPNYIYFDLRAGGVSVTSSTYTGYIYETVDGVTNKKTITGSHNESNKYYVYQSTSFNENESGLVDGTMIIPDYNPIYVGDIPWKEYISNNQDVLSVIDSWANQVTGKRESTSNKITISVAGKKCDITIDNIWSTFQQASSGLTGGGLNIDQANTAGTHVTVNIKGDNRLGSLRYYSAQSNGKSTLTLNSYKGDNSEEGTLTVIGNQKLTRANGNYTSVSGSSNNVTENHWDSVIGGTDSKDAVYGLKIKGGTIYSGSTARENCTAIGGGGNGMGNIIIDGGNVTAVAYTTGTAIGGGIAHTSYGGTSNIVINNGKVYAYNFGQPAHDVIKNYGSGASAELIEAASHIAGTAIGGASSILSSGNQTTAYITINGGEVYAESLGGCGIGAGNSVNTTAGSADVKINGGTVIANSKGQENYEFSDGKKINIKPGVSIGGGTGGIKGNGGYAKITINGGKIITGSIGGGSTTNQNGQIGYANINISGGDINGQFIMVKGATEPCLFNMTGGKIHDSNTNDIEYAHLQENGGALYIDDPNGTATISGGTIENCVGENGGAVYMTAGTFNLKNNGIIKDCETSNHGGAIYLGKSSTTKGTFNMTGGNIVNNKALNGAGGAIYLDGGDANVSGGIIKDNESNNGGGAYLAGGTLNISNGSFVNNKATNNGGGAFVNSGNIEMTGGSFEGNSATNNGGGVYLAGGTLNINNGEIKDNKSNDGAGAYLAGGALNISGGTFMSNSATNNGGGAFVNSGNIEMTGGSFNENSAVNDGGGVCLAGGTLNFTDGSILNNESNNGGGAYLAGGTLNIENGSFYKNTALQNGGGAFVNSGNIEMTGGSFNNNVAQNNGGGAYVSGGDFILNGDNAIFTNNKALNGGGVYLTGGTPNLFKGSLIENIAFKDGGGIYIDKQIVELSPIGEVIISSNIAGYIDRDIESSYIGRGGGIFIEGTPNLEDAGFSVDLLSTGNVSITNNSSKDYGGGVCINEGYFNVEGDNIKVAKNNSYNGGGVAVLAGNFDLSAGTIGGIDEANKAVNGGGVYVSGGDVLITKNGTISYNVAENNGGGMYIANGNVKMIGGLIDNNKAIQKDGGGIYVSANNKDVSIEILSGIISNNKANLNGGALSVAGNKSGSEIISVTIGVNKKHYDNNGNFISCEHGDSTYSSYDCPMIINNISNNKGGAIYITGGRLTKLNVYCLEELNNFSLGDDDRSNFMMVEGGSVIISTCENNVSGSESDYGHNEINGSIRVTAGAMDLYGSMDNPKIKSPITVDITSSEDYYRDHRTQSEEDKYYKLQYFENFKNNEGIVTGQYTIYQIPHGDSIEISGVIYNHPGYEIIGWFTQANGGGTRYDVGQNVTFNNDPVGDLTIYAIWQAHSYYVEFLPNIPDGVLFEGNMEKVQYTYNTEYELPENKFFYPGHIFVGWQDQYGNVYENQQIVSNLSGIDGDTIYLSAIWHKCSHDVNDPNFNITYTYSAEGNTLKKTCDCLEHEETITINVENVVYDGNIHNATLSYSGTIWQEDVELTHLLDGAVVIQAVNAGNYTVNLSYGGHIASATFLIGKADQIAPNKPTFTPIDDGNVKKIIVTNSDLDLENKEYDYRISYYSNNQIIDLDWQKSNEFSLPVTCTNYIIFIRYAGDINHNPSPETRADQTYYYSTEVSVIIDCCEGFICLLEENQTSGLNIVIVVLDGYYMSSEFAVSAVTRYTETQELSLEQAKVSIDNKLLYDIPSKNDTKYEITLTIVGAKKIVVSNSAITGNESFGLITGSSATIARDSAFTAYFEVKNYDSYKDLRLVFDKKIPVDTTIILINTLDNSYWYYKTTDSLDNIKLESFKEMGGTSYFEVSGQLLNYQFIIDFSLTENGCFGDSLIIDLMADSVSNDVLIPNFVGSQKTVYLENVYFEINDVTSEGQEGLEKDLYFEFAETEGIASKWENKVGALVITPIDELPADARIKLIQDNKTAYYYFNEESICIIPIIELDSNNLKIILTSDLFTEEGKTYKVNVKFYASNSAVGISPLNGILVGELSNDLAFKSTPKLNCAIKISGEDRVINEGGVLKVKIEYILPSDCTISGDLMRKGENGEYSSSGARPVIEAPGEMNISLAGLDAGSYCLRVVIKDSDGITLLSVPYYFVIHNFEGSTIEIPKS